MNSSDLVTAHNNARSRRCCDCSGCGPTRRACPRWGDGRTVEGRKGRNCQGTGTAFSPGQGTFHIASALIFSTTVAGEGVLEGMVYTHFPDGIRKVKQVIQVPATSQLRFEPWFSDSKFKAPSLPPCPLLQMAALIQPGLEMGGALLPSALLSRHHDYAPSVCLALDAGSRR